MEDVFSHPDLVLRAFWVTIQLALYSGLGALVFGTALLWMRVGPIAVLRRVAALYVTVVRNTPLLIVFVLIFIAAPNAGWLVEVPFLAKATLAITLYTSTFVCEALRAGINAVPFGQAEAARALGFGFAGNLINVVLPQALRAAVPPLTNVLIAMVKNTSIAAAFGIAEATSRMRFFSNRNSDETMLIFAIFAVGYIMIVEAISFGSNSLERRWRIAR